MAANNSPLPSHVGIIMDGNGRWAGERGMPRTSGHKEGLEAAKRIVAHAAEKGIQVLSLYVFSTENWRRTREEIDFLMNLIRIHLRRQYDFYREHKLKIIHSGNLEPLPKAVKEEIALAESDTAEFEGMKVNLLVNYGGRDEIIRAVKGLAAKKADLSSLTEQQLGEGLDCPLQLDLLIRTGGERRLSNFLLWQAAYAELYFSDVYWPDWSPRHFDEALSCYQSRQRRFGGT
ncbi:MAG: di-trans,poly-cis-decaprenylcistransferase [Spirochaeta sp. LUC14_002_19_P3]|nr:MAG: di-trans,poly-cis-decaprenylcistransferase [Spirochaeta sp. LUC14_002_19_P3]